MQIERILTCRPWDESPASSETGSAALGAARTRTSTVPMRCSKWNPPPPPQRKCHPPPPPRGSVTPSCLGGQLLVLVVSGRRPVLLGQGDGRRLHRPPRTAAGAAGRTAPRRSLRLRLLLRLLSRPRIERVAGPSPPSARHFVECLQIQRVNQLAQYRQI